MAKEYCNDVEQDKRLGFFTLRATFPKRFIFLLNFFVFYDKLRKSSIPLYMPLAKRDGLFAIKFASMGFEINPNSTKTAGILVFLKT